ncbi:MAG: M20 family metallopeptidase [Candidatus Hermodarchaeota archaeon]
MWKEKVNSYIDEIKDKLISVSKEIFDNPETAFKEFKASQLLADELHKAGFEVELGVAGLETAIQAVHPAKTEGSTIAILGEYDALPEIGHGCGHNLIATAALGASLALGKIKANLPGKLIFFGTPAEEEGGGKIKMVQSGLFDDVDVAMMFHPSSGYTMAGRGSLAMTEVKIEFFGKAAHSSNSPEDGINALDAVIQTFNGINALRQHIKSSARIHGIITHGGIKPNIVPDYAAACFYVRSPDNKYCDELLNKLRNIVQGAALATGATHSFNEVSSLHAMKCNRLFGETFIKNLETLGVPIKPLKNKKWGSTDMGNVSHVVPSIHPYIQICDENIPGHSREFAKAAISQQGQETMLQAAKAFAMTAIDLYTNPELVKQIKEEFRNNP